MRIEGLASEERDGALLVSANVVWEDRERPTQKIVFETAPSRAIYADVSRGAEPNLHPFLVAACVSAWDAGERRIAIEGSVSPRLQRGVTTALSALCGWYTPGRWVPVIEASAGRRPDRLSDDERHAPCGIMLSGGLDSMWLFRQNRLRLPLDHPRSVRVGIFVDGFDINAPGARDETEFADRAFAAVERAVAGQDLELVRVRTNLRELGSSWPDAHHGAALAAVAHACSDRVSRMMLASGPCWSQLAPHGSHPLLDRHYSSESVEIELCGMNDSRVDKARVVGDWPEGLKELRVCWKGIQAGAPLNCSVCHKCVLTMLALVSVGRLADCEAFAFRDVTPEMVGVLRPRIPGRIDFLEELIEPLRSAGRPELAAAVEAKLVPVLPSKIEAARAAVRSSRRSLRRGLKRLLGVER